MAHDTTRTLIALGVTAAVGYFLYQRGEEELKAGLTSGLANFSSTIDSILGNINVTTPSASSSSSGGALPSTPSSSSSSSSGIGGGGVYAGTAADIMAAAQQAGIGQAEIASGQADPYGAALWSLQSGEPQSQFYSQPVSVRATFDSVAVYGH